jgi:hypothetical protein
LGIFVAVLWDGFMELIGFVLGDEFMYVKSGDFGTRY